MTPTVSQKLDILVNQSGVAVNTITVTDTSNYAFYGLNINDFLGILTVLFDGVEIYSNSDYDNPDIASGLGTKELPLVLDEDSNPKQGTYSITLSIKNTSTLETASNTTSYIFNCTSPVVNVTITADGYASTLVSNDSTDYTGFTYTRTHEVVVPIGSGIVDTTSTSATISYAADIWSGVYTSTVTSVITYINGFLTVVDEIVGSDTITVYKISRNTVVDAISSFNAAYNLSVGSNPHLSVTYGVLSNRIDGYTREYNGGLEEHDTQTCYDALVKISELLSPDYISSLFTITEEIIPFNFTVTTETEILNFINAITASTSDINKLKGLDVSTGRVVTTDGTKIKTQADFKFDGNNLDVPVGGEYRVGGVNILDTVSSNISSHASNEFPLMDGVASPGISNNFSRDDHKHPSDTTKAPADNPTFTGTVTVPDNSFSYAKIQNVSATDKILGRSSSGAGDIEEITCTAAGRALLDDVSVVAQKTTLGLENVTNENKSTMFTNAALTGNPTAPTQAEDDSSTKIANTEFVSVATENMKRKIGLYKDTPSMNMTVIRNPQKDNSLPISGKKIFKVLSSGAFDTSMIGKRFKCTNAGSGTGDFREGTSLLLKHHKTTIPWMEDIVQDTPITKGYLISGKNYKIITTQLNHFGVGKVVGDTFTAAGTEACDANNTVSLMSFNLILNNYYTIVSAGTPTNWGGTVLTPEEGIEAGVWYIVQDDTITYNSVLYSASTYDAYATAANSVDGANLSPVIFKGVAGQTTYTGLGNVYELNYIVCNSSTGNGGTSGTITLNWLPNDYSLFSPVAGKEWALHAVTYGGVTRDKTLKITGGNYLTKTLNFEVSGIGGYTTFLSSNFENRMVALYNPFNSTFDVEFYNRLFYPRPAYATKYDAGTGIFRRKTDGKYCILLFGIKLSESFGQIGYYTTDDFVTTVSGNNGKEVINGKLTDTYLSSGNLTIGYKYKITKTETNHFGTGLVVGDYFTASTATACDANNIVRLVDPIWRYSGLLNSVEYVGQASDGKHIWEGVIYYQHDESIGRFGRKVEFLQFDETFSDEHFKSISIDLDSYFGDSNETNMYMVQYPYYVYYGGKHRISILGFTTDISAAYPMYTYEYISSNGKYGAYTTRNVVHVRDADNDAYPCSRDIEYFHYFIYNSKLWALASATSVSAYCGFDASKRQISLWRFSDEENKWYIDSRSPVVLSPIYSTPNLWNSEYAQYHLGIIALTVESAVLQLLVTANDTSDNYTTFHGTLDLSALN